MDRYAEDDLARRISLIERKISHLYEIQQRTEPDFEAKVSAEVIALAKQNRMIEAVKLQQELTGSSLAEAKAAIDQISSPG